MSALHEVHLGWFLVQIPWSLSPVHDTSVINDKQKHVHSISLVRCVQGSDAELEEAAVVSHRERCVLLAQQPRRVFHQTTNLSDKDSSELWNSSQMECRPFKDPTYDLRRLEQDIGVQAVPLTQDLAIQATPARVSFPTSTLRLSTRCCHLLHA